MIIPTREKQFKLQNGIGEVNWKMIYLVMCRYIVCCRFVLRVGRRGEVVFVSPLFVNRMHLQKYSVFYLVQDILYPKYVVEMVYMDALG